MPGLKVNRVNDGGRGYHRFTSHFRIVMVDNSGLEIWHLYWNGVQQAAFTANIPPIICVWIPFSMGQISGKRFHVMMSTRYCKVRLFDGLIAITYDLEYMASCVICVTMKKGESRSCHYSDLITSVKASQLTGVAKFCSAVCPGAD